MLAALLKEVNETLFIHCYTFENVQIRSQGLSSFKMFITAVCVIFLKLCVDQYTLFHVDK